MNIQKMSSVSVHPIRASFFQIDFSANLRNHFTCLYNLISRLNEVHASAAQKKKISRVSEPEQAATFISPKWLGPKKRAQPIWTDVPPYLECDTLD